MSSLESYELILPTSVQPQNGWRANDRIQFRVNYTGKEIKAGTVRLNGLLQLWSDSDCTVPAAEADKLVLNPNAGINGFFKQIQVSTEMQGNIETINDFGRLIAMENEAKYYQMDHGTSSDSMMEIMTYQNDNLLNATDFKQNVTSGLKFPITENATEIPFSVDLAVCLNQTGGVNIPQSKTGVIELNIILQDNTKVGMRSFGNQQNVEYTYTMTNCEIRFTSLSEQKMTAPLLMQVRSSAAIPVVLNKVSGIEFSAAHPFSSVMCSFLMESHNNSNTLLEYDYLATEAPLVEEQIDVLEYKLNGQDGPLQYPLTFQTSEILQNYILSMSYANKTNKHGFSYPKLTAETPTGYGVGVNLGGLVPAGTRSSFLITLKRAPATPYRMFCYCAGVISI
jgi:hypothetical protein